MLHDVAKPVTRGELEGRVLFVSHDSLGTEMVRRIGRRLGLTAWETDLTATLNDEVAVRERVDHDRGQARRERTLLLVVRSTRKRV